ncbi:MAG: glycosyltransferase family 2 protein [Paracoccaceae bacterium]
MPKTQLVSCVKDEAVFMVEWVAHHHLLGFDDICIYTNDCTDGTVELLEAIQAAGYCRRFDNPVPEGAAPQSTAYRRHAKLGRGDSYDHQMVLDCDEFLNIHTGNGSLFALLAAIPDGTDLLCINWRNFGDSNRKAWEPGCVTAQFEHALAINAKPNKLVKTLVLSPRKFDRLGTHTPRRFIAQGPLVVLNGALKYIDVPTVHRHLLWKTLRNGLPEHRSHKLAQINHYSVKTADSFVLRQLRGRGASTKADRHTAEFFADRNKNDEIERSIARYRPRLRDVMAAIRSHSAVAEAEAAAIAQYRIRLSLAPALS